MEQLLLLRHGKSDWNAAFDSDHERPINSRGRRESEAMGRFLATSGIVPDRILCSTALRTRQTLARVMDSAGWEDVSVAYVDTLYLAALSTAKRVINAQAVDVTTLLVVGHEPTMSGLVHDLTGQEAHITTATLAVLQTPTGTAESGHARLLSVVNAKSLP